METSIENQPFKRLGVNRFFHWLGKTAYKLTGWRTEGKPPEIPKAVVIVAHHTSNWDFLVGLMASFIWKFSPFWLGKHTLFRWPLGGLLRRLGGIPVDRRASRNLVEQVTRIFQSRERFWLTIAPEGTRQKAQKWKSGFYHIARSAGVPIICAFLDYKRKVAGIGPIIFPGEDLAADMQKIREFYNTVTGKYPERAGVVDISP